jgi:hypothetical protein
MIGARRCTLEGMGVDAYRTRSARSSYPAEPSPQRCDAPITYDFDAPSAGDVNDLYLPPRWLTDTRVVKVTYAVIIAGMVIVFILGFRG